MLFAYNHTCVPKLRVQGLLLPVAGTALGGSRPCYSRGNSISTRLRSRMSGHRLKTAAPSERACASGFLGFASSVRGESSVRARYCEQSPLPRASCAQSCLGSGFRLSGFGFRPPDSEFRVSNAKVQDTHGICLRWAVSAVAEKSRVPDSGFRIPGFRFWVPGSGFRVSSFEFWVLKFRVPDFEFPAPSFECKVSFV